MIITGHHPDVKKITAYDRYGSPIHKILELDTHQMVAKIFVRLDAGTIITKLVRVYKIKGPGIYFKRHPKKSRTINTARRK
jgi:hypothetical protein